jgi:hypothetical protein
VTWFAQNSAHLWPLLLLYSGGWKLAGTMKDDSRIQVDRSRRKRIDRGVAPVILLLLQYNFSVASAWTPIVGSCRRDRWRLNGRENDAAENGSKPAGSFFNPVPPSPPPTTADPLDGQLRELIRKRRAPSLASQPSTMNGVPTAQAATAGMGFKYNGIGPPDTRVPEPLNHPSRPEYDDQGFTVYTDETTGLKSRVFEALVQYPCEFTMKVRIESRNGDCGILLTLTTADCRRQ